LIIAIPYLFYLFIIFLSLASFSLCIIIGIYKPWPTSTSQYCHAREELTGVGKLHYFLCLSLHKSLRDEQQSEFCNADSFPICGEAVC
jgi:hypothetical protein